MAKKYEPIIEVSFVSVETVLKSCPVRAKYGFVNRRHQAGVQGVASVQAPHYHSHTCFARREREGGRERGEVEI